MQFPPLRTVIAKYGIDACKDLGQHFLLDKNITDKIVSYSGELAGLNVIEIGAGPGGLTRSIICAAGKDNKAKIATLTVIEKDSRVIPILQDLKQQAAMPMNIINADALQIDLIDIVPAPRVIIANLPYNIGTELLIKWLYDMLRDVEGGYKFMSLMFQKEVAQRIMAQPNSKLFGRISILAQYLCEIKHLFDLPASVFWPPPKVESTMLKFTASKFLAEISIDDIKILERITKAAFGQRRKMLRSSLKTLNIDANSLLKHAGIEPTLRAEQLTIEDFTNLCSVYKSIC